MSSEWEAAAREYERGVGALVATSACLKRPKYKYEPWDGPCGRCAPCVAKAAREKFRAFLAAKDACSNQPLSSHADQVREAAEELLACLDAASDIRTPPGYDPKDASTWPSQVEIERQILPNIKRKKAAIAALRTALTRTTRGEQ